MPITLLMTTYRVKRGHKQSQEGAHPHCRGLHTMSGNMHGECDLDAEWMKHTCNVKRWAMNLRPSAHRRKAGSMAPLTMRACTPWMLGSSKSSRAKVPLML